MSVCCLRRIALVFLLLVFAVPFCGIVSSSAFVAYAEEEGGGADDNAKAEEGGAEAADAAVDEGADIDVSDVTASDCKECKSKGFITCPFCKGKGTSFIAKIQCPKCNGEGKLPCGKCKDGTVKCSLCKEREVGGKKLFCVVSPEWKKWEEEYGHIAEDLRKKHKIPKEPEQYVECPRCKGTGRAPCPRCSGTQFIRCKRCGGDGEVTGPGQCHVCKGLGIVACAECAVFEGIEKKKSYQALVALLEQKLLKPEEFYKRLRDLVAKEKARAQKLKEKKEAAEKAKESLEKAKAEEDKKRLQMEAEEGRKAEEKAKRDMSATKKKEAFGALMDAYGSGILDYKLMHQKARELGLDEQAVLEIQKEKASGNPKVKKLLKLKEDFRAGKMDLDEFKAKVGEL